MQKKIEQLESASACLDPSTESRREMTGQVFTYADSFLGDLAQMNGYEADEGRHLALDSLLPNRPEN